MYVVPETEIAGLVDPETCLEAVEGVFRSMAERTARNFPVVRETLGHADAIFGIKSGFDGGGLALGLKAGGFWPGNGSRGLANHQSAIFLFDPDTGRCRACLGANLITALRTAAASALSIKYLARPDAEVLGMIGAGHQSLFQLRAALRQRPFKQVIGWNRHPETLARLEACAAEERIPFRQVSLDELGAEADVIISVTSSFAPILMKRQVKAGTHLACMGTDTRGKQEMDPDLVAGSTVFTDEIGQAVSIGECQHAVAAGLLDRAAMTEIGAVLNGIHPGRTSSREITLFDGTGVALQDLAVAAAVLELAIEQGRAVHVEM